MKTNFCNKTFISEGCDDLPACVVGSIIATYWKPNEEELASIASGIPIRICVIGNSIQPMSVDTETL